MVTEAEIRSKLQSVKYPGYSRDIVSFGLVKAVSVAQGAATITIQLTSGTPEMAQQIKTGAEQAVKSIPGIDSVFVDVRLPANTPATPQAGGSPFSGQSRVAGLKKIIAVASGKGGVGKSTTSVNLACALSQLGLKVGLLDCDIYGPSIPLMMGIRHKPTVNEAELLVPLQSHGVSLMSIGFIVEGDAPVIWRGPMITKTIQQFFHSVAWGDLDVLLVDLPPGTGDAQLSLCQTVPLDGGVIVTTPQEASLGVVRKGIGMFEKVNVPLLGLVENMSYFTAPGGERVEIFGHGGGRLEAARLRIPFLGEVPIFVEIREGGDKGVPVVVSAPESPAGTAFLNIARALKEQSLKG